MKYLNKIVNMKVILNFVLLETHLSGEFPPPTGRESRVQAAPPPNPTTLGEGHTESG